ncbi:MAG: hypothetical protein ACQKBY_08635, partial [Verrucomicrobiales bacterium]
IDHAILRDALTQLNPATLPVGGSDLADAVRVSSRALQATKTSVNQLVLLSDGEEHNPALLRAGASAARYGTIIHALGFGTAEGGFIPDASDPEGKFRDRAGFPVVSRLNEELLQALAEGSGGLYGRRGAPGFLDELKESLQRGERAESPEREIEVATLRYRNFLLPAVLCLLLAPLLPVFLTRRQVLSSAAPVLLAFLFLSLATAQAGEAARGRQAFAAQRYDAAHEHFSRAAEDSREEENRQRYQLAAATAAYHAGSYEDSLSHADEAAGSPEKTISAEARFVQGNARYQIGARAEPPRKREAWEAACEAYRSALRDDPTHQAAAENLAFLLDQLAQLPPPEDDPPPNPEDPAPPEDPEDQPPSEKPEGQPGSPPPPASPRPQDDPTPENEEEEPADSQPDPDAELRDPQRQPEESPEDYARRVLGQHSRLGPKPPRQNPPPPPRDKDW